MKKFKWMTSQTAGATPTQTLHRLPGDIRNCIIILIVAHFLCEVPSLLWELFPKWSEVKVDWFLCPSFHLSIKRDWYMRYLSVDVFELLTYYCFAKIAKQYSTTLFLVIVVLFAYHIVDCLMYLWNFKTYHYIYFDLLWTAMILIRRCIKPYRPETIARIKSLF